MLEYNTFTCYTWAGSGIHTGDCIVLCVARNAGVQYVHLLHWVEFGIHTGGCIVFCAVRNAGVQYLLHLGRLWYSHRWLHYSLRSQEFWSTICSPATPGQALVFAQVTSDCIVHLLLALHHAWLIHSLTFLKESYYSFFLSSFLFWM